MASMGTGLAVPVPHRRFPTSSPVRVWYGQVFIGVHIPMSMTPCLSSLNNPPRWSLPTTPDTAGHLKVEMMECTPRSRCRGMHPVHKGQQKGGMREQAEKGLKELIKAALEEDSDDDNKPVDLGNAPGNAPPADVLPLASMDNSCAAARGVAEASMRQGSGSGGAGRRQARVSDHGRCTGQRRRRASKPTPRMLPRRAGGGAAQGSPVLQRGSVVAARRRQQASKASVYADALPCEHVRSSNRKGKRTPKNLQESLTFTPIHNESQLTMHGRGTEHHATSTAPARAAGCIRHPYPLHSPFKACLYKPSI
ncbi:hypothetical protein GGX14DRAFT_408135 [Mycena pura]|uniref:Uncharacterized protein n=1 Tax=Mycena pura TaxID=153505 RepID=A0AAD6UNG6_9AGAR|nr:hypothetical protein GGX14DRAFT_408135 [Mycena pura]